MKIFSGNSEFLNYFLINGIRKKFQKNFDNFKLNFMRSKKPL